MSDHKGKATRRQFIKTTAAASGSAFILGFGCTDDENSPLEDDGGTLNGTDSGNSTGNTDVTIFSPGTIGTLDLKNRTVRSATGECLAFGGATTEEYLNVFKALAAGGVGMIISGMTAVTESDSNPLQLYAFDDSHLDELKIVKSTVHSIDPSCKLVAQIAHSGNAYMGDSRTGPSDISWPADTKPMRPLTELEIGQVVQDFATAAHRFQQAGWDGVEIHGAHGYLLSSFLSSYTNKRTDNYGGSLENRIRIVKEIIAETRKLVGNDFPLMIKLNSSDSGDYVGAGVEGGIDQQLFVQTATEIAKLGVDAIDVSGNNWNENDLGTPDRQSLFLNAATALDVDIPVILTGGNRTVGPLETILKSGEVDFLGLARPLIREPDLPNKWLSGETDKAKCINCNLCYTNIISGLQCHQESA